MVSCPECDSSLDVDADEVDAGEVVSCVECGTDFEVVTASPLELKAVGEGYEEDDEEEPTEEDENGDY
jgi:alpha-aminoadipate carrier protein LysW